MFWALISKWRPECRGFVPSRLSLPLVPRSMEMPAEIENRNKSKQNRGQKVKRNETWTPFRQIVDWIRKNNQLCQAIRDVGFLKTRY